MALFSYDDESRRESLLSILKDISPLDGNYLMENLGTSTAKNTLHEWPVRHISRDTSVTTRAEGFEAGEGNPQAPTRSNNITAIVAEEVKVSGTERATDTATHEDPFTDQKEIALRKLNQQMEYKLINGNSKTSGASGTARDMLGIDGAISSHVTARNSGTSMTVNELEDIQQEVWEDVGNGFTGSTLLVPMGIARTIAGFTTNVQNYVEETDVLHRNITTFQGSSGEVKVVPHKDVRNTSGSATAYLVNDDMFRVAYLENREPQWKDLAVSGDYDYGMYVGEFTLESLAEKASAKRTGYKKEAH